jgi:hypothetical protein
MSQRRKSSESHDVDAQAIYTDNMLSDIVYWQMLALILIYHSLLLRALSANCFIMALVSALFNLTLRS